MDRSRSRSAVGCRAGRNAHFLSTRDQKLKLYLPQILGVFYGTPPALYALSQLKKEPTKTTLRWMSMLSPKLLNTFLPFVLVLAVGASSSCKHTRPSQTASSAATKSAETAEFSLAEVTKTLTSGTYAIISAERNPSDPDDLKLSDAAIEGRYASLKMKLDNLDYRVGAMTGHYENLVETAYFVVLPDLSAGAVIVRLGKVFKQDSVMIGSGGTTSLVFTSGTHVGQAHVGQGWGPVLEATSDHSAIPTTDGKLLNFNLNFDFDHFVPYSMLNGASADGADPTASSGRDGADPRAQEHDSSQIQSDHSSERPKPGR